MRRSPPSRIVLLWLKVKVRPHTVNERRYNRADVRFGSFADFPPGQHFMSA